MKFGRNLPRNQVPEWASSYIKYKKLKKLIKSAVEDAKNGRGVDTAEFFYFLDRNLEDVDNFYNRKYEDSVRRLKLLQDRYGRPTDMPNNIDRDELEELMGALLELRGHLRKLQWYGEVNRRGFIKITKKLDKRVAITSTQRPYLEVKVDPKPFAMNSALSVQMKVVNDWLSSLADVKVHDDSSSTHSTGSIRRPSKAILSLPAQLLESLDQATRSDDAPRLVKLLDDAKLGESLQDISTSTLALNVLQRAVSCKAKACIDELLGRIRYLDDGDDFNKRNCIHRLVLTSGRVNSLNDERHASDTPQTQDSSLSRNNYIIPAASPVLAPYPAPSKELDGLTPLARGHDPIEVLKFLLDKLRPHQRDALRARDSYGRMPLHYAAQYGLIAICQIITARMKVWGQFDVDDGIDAPSWQDVDGYAPLHLSVIGGHPKTTQAILQAEDWTGKNASRDVVRKHTEKSGEVLALATKANSVVIVCLLVQAGFDVNYQDDQGESALHVAARFNHTECARALLSGSDHQKADTELTENAFGWTPLFLACVDGQLDMVQLLISFGADLERADASGWTAKEHAALRGHISIARLLAARTTHPASDPNLTHSEPTPPTSSPTSSTPSTTTSTASSTPLSTNPSLTDRKSSGTANSTSPSRVPQSVKTFGHRYLTKETMILVSLGSMDMRKSTEPVHLDRIPLANAHSTQLDTALSVVVSASEASGEPSIIDLPVHENVNTDPIVFMAMDATKVKLLFDIVPTYAGTNEQIVGRGVALLSSVKPNIGSKRITLQGDVSVPIIAATTLEVIGSVNFNFLIITPFKHPNMTITENQTYWKSMTSTMVIGHRGLGKNVAARKSLQLGENTIQSFIAAANLGASYVEFGMQSASRCSFMPTQANSWPDVQLTKDLVPVIYHDFLVSETGIDAPVHTLTLEQFLHVNSSSARTPRPSRPPSPASSDRTRQSVNGSDSRRHRSLSASGSSKDEFSEMSERMKHTRDFKSKGFKGNSRGHFIQAPFTTLEEMFKKLPEHIGFNIEMKYPMLHESEEQGMDTYAVELNSFVDTVLTKVYDLGKKRNIIFSSFNPDICLLLSFKQPSIPILFLTDAGLSPVGDIRASSLQEAIRFASRWNLLGVVTVAEPLIISPRLVRVVKESGLVCVSYGVLNNDPDSVQLQVREGIDAVIVDSVLAIRKGLTGPKHVAPPTVTTS